MRESDAFWHDELELVRGIIIGSLDCISTRGEPQAIKQLQAC